MHIHVGIYVRNISKINELDAGTLSISLTDHPRCEETEWRCNSGQCILQTKMCDLIPDCEDGSDEYDCGISYYTFNIIRLGIYCTFL